MAENFSHFMIDIETLGTKPDAAVTQIGIVGFDPTTKCISVPFSINVDIHDKSTIDQSTVFWWMQQDEVARESVFAGKRVSPKEGLEALSKFIADNSDEVVGYKVWSKPSTFDLVILESLYRNCGMQVPWAHWNTRCLRTLIDNAKLSRDEEYKSEVPHEAGYDAEAQAKTALKCMLKLDNGHARE